MEYTQEKYQDDLKELHLKHELEINNLARVYALANNPYKLGDIVEDHTGKLLIEKITFTRGFGFNGIPECVFRGIELRKDGTPMKKQDKNRTVYQSNIKTKNGRKN